MSDSPNEAAHDGKDTLLAGIRVVDLSDGKNLLCGKLLADLGATVVKVDAQSTSPAGSAGDADPVAHRRWLYWQAYNAGKQSVLFDESDADQRAQLRSLVLDSDILIESAKPGSLRRLGLDYDSLSAITRELIYVSITPFGQSGPYSQFEGTDIALQAMGAHMAVTGERERSPLSMGVEVAYRHGGAEAAAATMLALFSRQRTGSGQHVDVSIQQCVIWTLLNSTMTPQLLNRDDERGGSLRKERGRDLLTRVVWACKDGIVHFVPIGGGGGKARSASYRKFVAWMEEDGLGDPVLTARDWNGKDLHSVTQAEYDQLVVRFDAFLRTKTIAELYDRAVRERLLLAPITRVPDLLDSEQLSQRAAFGPVEVDGRKALLPGRFAVLSGTPLNQPAEAPAPGQHSAAWLSDSRPARASARRPAPPARTSGRSSSVFAGVKVADFAWAAAGPIITKCLADHGATVVRVESTTHPDSIRLGGPFKDGIPGVNRSGFYADFNTSKQSIVLDMTTESGRAIARRLVDWADVLTESYTPGVMTRFGLGYEQLREQRPDLVMLSTCMQGQDGPYKNYAGYGGQGAAIAGLHYVTGWPDLDPAGPKGAYTDAITPRFGIAALVAALAYRDRTGRGQHIDLSQIEASLQFLSPEILDYQTTGTVAGPMGNRSRVYAPHGSYPCEGEDRWVAIGIETDEQFQALARVIGAETWLADPQLRTVAGRLARPDELDAVVSAWTSRRSASEAMHQLQRAGVPAGAVQRPSDLFRDPQLAHRGHFWELEHPELGTCLYNGASFHLSETPARPTSSAPLLGAHTRSVLTGLLGYSDREVDDFGYAQILQ